RHVEVDHTLDHEGETKDQADQYGRHPGGITFDETLLEHLVCTFHGRTIGIDHFRSGALWLVLGHYGGAEQAGGHQAGHTKVQELAYHVWVVAILIERGVAEGIEDRICGWPGHGGERGIRTPDTPLRVYALSRRAPSTARPSLRSMLAIQLFFRLAGGQITKRWIVRFFRAIIWLIGSIGNEGYSP